MIQYSRLPDRRNSLCRSHGFTLIEVMIVVAIIAILAAISLPMYFDSVRKSRRGEAIAALNQIAQAQERFRANCPCYAASLTAATLAVCPATCAATTSGLGLSANTASGYYTLAISANSGTGYTLTATAAGAQLQDDKCTSLTLGVNGGTFTYTSTGAATANKCWNR